MAQPAVTQEFAHVPVSSIRTDGGTQMRESIDSNLVQQYAEVLGAGNEMDPAIVFYDGTDYWLADGFHRYHASLQIQTKQLNCEIRSGTRRDAILYACGANEKNQKARTRADKHRAVLTLLRDEEWGDQKAWSNVRVAQVCKVSDVLVAALRTELAKSKEPRILEVPRDEPVKPELREGQDGKLRSMPGTSKAPGAARKRVVETVVEYDVIDPEEDLVTCDADEPDDEEESDPAWAEEPFTPSSPAAVPEESHEIEPEEPFSIDEPIVSKLDWMSALELLRTQRESHADYAANRARDKELRARLGSSKASLLIDFVLRGGETTLARLGLDYTSDFESAKSAYRAESIRCHPDRGGSQQDMTVLNAQFSVVREYFDELEKV